MDIGSLTGQIAIEDQLSGQLTQITYRVQQFAETFDNVFGGIAIAAGVATAAVGGMITSIIAMGSEGSRIVGVENAFDKLAATAGSTGDVLIGGLSAGVRGTVHEMDLMQSTTRLLSSGIKLSGDDMQTMGELAREMGKATGTDAANGVNILSMALLTGQTRQLKRYGIQVDLIKAETDFAKSLGVTREELSAAGKLEADRNAMLEAMRTKVQTLGVSELDFRERLQQGKVALEEWWESLSKAVATSPNVNHALETVSSAISKAFGSESQTLLTTIVGWVDRFADAVAHYGPSIIQTVADIWQGVKNLWHEVQSAWSLVPDWFKNMAKDAVLAGAALYITQAALVQVTQGGSDLLSTLGNTAQIWGTWGTGVTSIISNLDKMSISFKAILTGDWVVTGFVRMWAVIAAHPLVAVAAAIGAVTLAFVAWRQKVAEAELEAETFAAKQDAINKAHRDGGLYVKTYAEALEFNDERWRKLTGTALPLEEALKRLHSNTGNWNSQLRDLGDSVLAASKAGELLRPKLAEVADELKRSGLSAEQVKEISPALYSIGMATGVWNDKLKDSKASLINTGKTAAETLKATQESILSTEKVWDEYFTLQEKRSGSTLDVELLGIEQWYRKEIETLDKAKKYNQNYWNEREALYELYLEKQLSAQVSYSEKSIAESEKIGNEGAAAVAKGFAGMPNVLKGLMQTMGTATLDAKTLSGQGALIGDRFTDAQKLITAAMEKSSRSMIDLSDEELNVIDKLHEWGFTTQEIAAAMDLPLSQVEHHFKKMSENLDELMDALTQLAQISGDSFGGLVKGIAEAIGAFNLASKSVEKFQDAYESGSKIGMLTAGVGMATSFLSATKPGQGAAMGTLSGMATGAAIGGTFGPWGAAIGAGVGALTGLIRNIGGPSKAELEGRDIVKQFEEAHKGWQGLQQDLIAAGVSADQANSMITTMWNSEKQGAKATQAAVDAMTKVLADHEQKMKDIAASVDGITSAGQNLGQSAKDALQPYLDKLLEMNGLTEDQKTALSALTADAEPNYSELTRMAAEYGIKLEDLGPKFEQANIDERALKIYDDFSALTRAGGDVGGVLHGMADEIQGLVTDSMKFGTAIPENMRPLIEQLIATGELTDTAGVKLTDTSKINFEETPLQKSTKAIVDAIDKLGKLLEGLPAIAAAAATGMSDSLASVRSPTIDIHYRYVADNDRPATAQASVGGRIGSQYFETGGNVLAFTPRGTDVVPAMLTPGETVRTASQEYALQTTNRGNAELREEIARLRRDLQRANDALPLLLADALRKTA